MKQRILSTLCFLLLLGACQNRQEPQTYGINNNQGLLGLLNMEEGADYHYREKSRDYREESTAYLEGEASEGEVFLTASASASNPIPKTTISARQKLPQKLIKTASLSCEVKDYQQAKQKVDQVISKWQAYISEEQQNNQSNQINNNIIIRVPKENFDSLLIDLEKISLRIDNRHVKTSDVSEEFFDLESRMTTKKKLEQRYYEILKTAVKIEDVLKVEKELKILREEIERKEGRLNFLNDEVNYSTIRVFIYQQVSLPKKGYQPPSFFERIGGAFKKGWSSFLNFTIDLLYIWPFILLGILAFIFLRRLLKKRRKKV